MESLECLKNLVKIVKVSESKVDEIKAEASLSNPIKSDLVLTERNMAYNDMVAELKKFSKNKRQEKKRAKEDDE